LFKLTEYKNFKAIIVDNASTDSSVDMVKSEFKNVDLLENKENLGFIRGTTLE
jgi:GT2 family glycosyltransferase